MNRALLLLSALALGGCQTFVQRPDTSAGLIGAVAAPKDDATCVLRVRPRSLIKKLALAPGVSLAALCKGWLECTGVPLEQVESVTVVWDTEKDARCVHVRCAGKVDRAAVRRACAAAPLSPQVEFGRGPCFRMNNGPRRDYEGSRWLKDLAALGEADLAFWASPGAEQGKRSGGLPPLPDGLRSAAFGLLVGEALELKARLHFSDDAHAEKGAKAVRGCLTMARVMVLQAAAEADALEAFPEQAKRLPAKQRTGLLLCGRMIKPVERELSRLRVEACGAVVPVSLRAAVPIRDLGQFAALAVEELCSGKGRRHVGGLFGQKPREKTTVPLYYAPPPLPAPPPPALAIANLRKEPVKLFSVENGELRYLKTVPPGEAVDLTLAPNAKLAATFAGAPYCVNYTVKCVQGEAWLLRPAPAPVLPRPAVFPAARPVTAL